MYIYTQVAEYFSVTLQFLLIVNGLFKCVLIQADPCFISLALFFLKCQFLD